MADENRIITFNYARTTWDQFKKQTIPSNNKGMTKDEINTFLNADQSYLSGYASNRLVPRSKFVGVSSGPIVFGDLHVDFYGSSNGNAGYIEFNKLYFAEKNNISQVNVLSIGNPGNSILNANNTSIGSTMTLNPNGLQLLEKMIDKGKELSNLSSYPGIGLSVKITGSMVNNNGGHATSIPLEKVLYESAIYPSTVMNPIPSDYINVFMPDNYLSKYNFHYMVKTGKLASPDWININDEISSSALIDLYHTDKYGKRNDPHDTVGFHTSLGRLYNTDYFSFGRRQVYGNAAQWTSAPVGTPNFPRPNNINGAMDVRYFFAEYKITMEYQINYNGGTIRLGSLTLNLFKDL